MSKSICNSMGPEWCIEKRPVGPDSWRAVPSLEVSRFHRYAMPHGPPGVGPYRVLWRTGGINASSICNSMGPEWCIEKRPVGPDSRRAVPSLEVSKLHRQATPHGPRGRRPYRVPFRTCRWLLVSQGICVLDGSGLCAYMGGSPATERNSQEKPSADR